jgi:hypothetical protein
MFVCSGSLYPKYPFRSRLNRRTTIPLYQGLAPPPLGHASKQRFATDAFHSSLFLSLSARERVCYLAERSRAIPRLLLLRPKTRQRSRLMKKIDCRFVLPHQA